MVTEAQRNAGHILINVKVTELVQLRRKLDRVRELMDLAVKPADMPYTDENMTTLLTHSIAALVSGNWLMIQFWMDATLQIGEDIRHCVRVEQIRQHQARRIGCIAERIGVRVKEIDGEIKAIRDRIGGN